ncbi:MAG: ACR3 family arsenite efflux transporter [Sphingomonadaceae bacterium]
MASTAAALPPFERYLSLWVFAAILAGLGLGLVAPDMFAGLAAVEVAHVNLPVALLIWAMIFPMMVGVEFAGILRAFEQPRGLLITLTVNWLVKPFSMAALGVLFLMILFADLIPPADAEQYLAGLILLGAAPCTAMVFVWAQLVRGDPNYTLAQVGVNDAIMVVAFAPIVALLLGLTDLVVPWETLLLSVLLYVALPLLAGIATRRRLMAAGGPDRVTGFQAQTRPWSILGLLLTVVLLFGFQAPIILASPLVVALIAAPILVQSYLIFALAYAAAWAWRVPHAVAAPCALIGTSNFFELAVAVAISLFGLGSGAALATVVGVLVEVPVMLSLVAIANRTRPAIEARARAKR